MRLAPAGVIRHARAVARLISPIIISCIPQRDQTFPIRRIGALTDGAVMPTVRQTASFYDVVRGFGPDTGEVR